MTRAETVLDLAGDDGFPALRRRLLGAAAGLLYLVVPAESRALETPVRMRLLARLADRAPYRLVVVSSDRKLRRWAKATGLAAFASLERARSGRLPARSWSPPWGTIAGRLALRRRPESVGVAARAATLSARSDLTWPRTHRTPAPTQGRRLERREAGLLMGLAAGTLLLFLFAAVLIVPGAQIELALATYSVERSVLLQVDAGASSGDPANLLLAGRAIEVGLSGREQVATGARRDVPDEPAQGTVIFISRRAESTVIPEGAVVSTSAGTIIRFRTVEETVVPAGFGSQARVAVEAVEAGLAGNVPALTVNRVEGALALQVGVLNDESMEGGTVQQAGYVTAEEKAQLRAALLQRLTLEGENSLAEGLAEEILLPGSVQLAVQREVYDQPVGAISDLLSLEIRVVVRGVAVAEEELRAATVEALTRDLDPSFQVLEEGMALLPGEVSSTEAGFELPLTVRGRFSSRVDTASLRDRLRGTSTDAAAAYLERHLDLSGSPTITVSPGWWGRMPFLPWRIELLALPREV
ncbi:MAG: baseplate J/gp47 family protein [Anaerolineae bacterium]